MEYSTIEGNALGNNTMTIKNIRHKIRFYFRIYLPWIVSIFSITLIFLLATFSSKFRIYLFDKWPEVLMLFGSVFLGVFFPFWLNNYQKEQDELIRFKKTLYDIFIETCNNHAVLNQIEKKLDNGKVFERLSVNLSESVLADPTLTKFMRHGIIRTSFVYQNIFRETNSKLDFIQRRLETMGILPNEEEKTDVKNQIAKSRKILQEYQDFLNKYMKDFDVRDELGQDL